VTEKDYAQKQQYPTKNPLTVSAAKFLSKIKYCFNTKHGSNAISGKLREINSKTIK